jgi:prevent-host-death family protein
MVRRALTEGPQTVTRHGDEVVVVLAIDTYRRLLGDIPEFKTYLASAPDLEVLEFSRDDTPAPVIEL